MTRSTLRTASTALAVAATLILAGCGSDSGSDAEETASASPAAEETTEEADPSAPVEVPDVTNLILVTGQDTLRAKDLAVDVVDESGEPVTVDDPTAYVVKDQDPIDGTVDPGTIVTLTVAPRG